MNHGSATAVATREDEQEALPDPFAVARRAVEIFDAIRAHREYDRLRTSTLKYPDCWATFTGYPIIAEWDLDQDGPHLFDEALKVMAMKAAVYEETGDERLAELDISAPVDEMVHALTAQFTVLSRMQAGLGLVFIHSTDNERFQYDEDGYTDQIYAAANWGVMPRRYWIGQAETERRLSVLLEHYESIGIENGGRSHNFTFSYTAG
ncbi:hypothetical protein CcI49_29995 [Frankia sp. CcI49]|uniref:hypothetical protein n=1 Tax=Frankia sp. CcI49 TaxID=1745382 RepID=UPI000977E665|nr:hypothetical protein [Frankia sp. CcI49]ONH54600.1 hypothetical protein CcI49_29995 [Frankia sp. CcI49]